MGSSCRKPRPLCCEICRLPQTKRGWVLKADVYVCCARMEHAHYCFKCRSNTKLANVEVRTSKNNRQVAVGSCTQCSGRVSRFMRRVLEEGPGRPAPAAAPQVAHATGPAAGSSQAPAAPTVPKPPAAPRVTKTAAPADDSAPTESQVPKRQRAPKKAASEPAIAVQM
eukprot:tig00021137_g19012.t1